MDTNKLNRLKAKARQNLRELEALLVIGNLMTGAARAKLERAQAELDEGSTIKRIQELLRRSDEKNAHLRSLLGARVSNSSLVEMLQFIESAPSGKSALIPVHVLKSLLSNAASTYVPLGVFSAHTRVHVYSTKPDSHAERKIFDWVSLEATLFEDMCALFNMALERQAKAQSTSRFRAKCFDALLRATASAAFYFIEAYMNGLAYDHYVKKKNRLDEDSKRMLTEWDESGNKPKYLSLRNKLLQYPRIILGEEHPPLTESNTPEIGLVCGNAKLLRDAIVHASPQPDRATLEPSKEAMLFNPDFEEVQSLVDSAVSLVRKVELVVRGTDKGLSWMKARAADGSFPEDAFL